MTDAAKGFQLICSNPGTGLQLGKPLQVFLPNITTKRHVHELTFSADFDQTSVSQFLEVVGESSRSYWNVGFQMSTSHLVAAGNAGEYLKATRISESLGDAMELPLG